MIDGTTGIQVAPITEDDMNRVQSILKKAIDAAMAFSQISADVDMLRQTVSGLQADTERLRNQNNALDEALNYSRSERDRQASELNETEQRCHNLELENHSQMEQLSKLDLANGQLQIDLDLTRKERDDAQFQALDLQERLAVAEGKLAKINEALGPFVSAPTPPTETKAESEPAPVQDPHPIQATAEQLQPKSIDWDKPHHWEPEKGWVNDPEPTPGDTHF